MYHCNYRGRLIYQYNKDDFNFGITQAVTTVWIVDAQNHRVEEKLPTASLNLLVSL